MTVLFLLFEKQVCSGKQGQGYIFSAALSITTIECGAGSERLLTAIKLFLQIFPRVVAILDFESRGRLSSRAAFFLHADAASPYIVGPTMLGVVASVLAVVCKRMQQLPTTCNKVCKRTQHVTSNNIGSCWLTMLRPSARGFKLDDVARLVTLRSR